MKRSTDVEEEWTALGVLGALCHPKASGNMGSDEYFKSMKILEFKATLCTYSQINMSFVPRNGPCVLKVLRSDLRMSPLPYIYE